MATKEHPDVLPELLKQLADGLSIHTKLASSYWLALALVSALTVMPTPRNGLSLPFLSVKASARDFYAFAFMLISLLVLGYGSTSCQAIRTRRLAQRCIDNSKSKFLHPYDIHIQDVFDSIVSPSVNRMAPLAQILRGKQQFYTQEQECVARRSLIPVIYFATLRLVSILVVYFFPSYALVIAFLKSSMFHLPVRLWAIPVYLFWLVGLVAMFVIVQLLYIDMCDSTASVRRMRGTAGTGAPDSEKRVSRV